MAVYISACKITIIFCIRQTKSQYYFAYRKIFTYLPSPSILRAESPSEHTKAKQKGITHMPRETAGE